MSQQISNELNIFNGSSQSVNNQKIPVNTKFLIYYYKILI